jgi:VIT1/CCC1 family predicted Fe2+/Mn2+ transporter
MIAIGVALCIVSHCIELFIISLFSKESVKEIRDWLCGTGIILITAGFIKFLWMYLP